jgi:hypothetical protein
MNAIFHDARWGHMRLVVALYCWKYQPSTVLVPGHEGTCCCCSGCAVVVQGLGRFYVWMLSAALIDSSASVVTVLLRICGCFST